MGSRQENPHTLREKDMGAFIILLISVTGLLTAAFYIYNLVDGDRRDEMEKMDQELAQVLAIRSKDND